MANFNTDDLLIKSQLLISKFRKQREASSKKQDYVISNGYSNCNPIIYDQINMNSKKMFGDCDSYPQRDNNNPLLNKFSKPHYFTNNVKLNRKKDDTLCNSNLSGSDNSLWSSSTDTLNQDLHCKPPIEKRDCGVMTESCKRINLDEEDIFTPVTALPPTIRSFSDRNKYDTLKENKSTENLRNKSKHYVSISTNHNVEDYSSTRDPINSNNYFKNSVVNNEKIDILMEENVKHCDENKKMKFALQLFHQEKKLDKEITDKIEFLNKLNEEMIQLTITMNSGQEYLNSLKIQKEELKNRRYEIFNGLSNELQCQLNVEREQNVTDRSHQSNMINSNEYGNSPDNILISTENEEKTMAFTLDDDTVRNIVDKIIYKEFANSEDKIFMLTNKKKIMKDVTNENSNNRTYHNNEECILSDVLSAKDLKINSHFMDEIKSTGYSSVPPPNQLPCMPHNKGSRICKSKPKKIQSAQSMDNLLQESDIPNRNISRPLSRKKMRSPAVSEELKHYLHYQSSSDEFSSTSKN